MAQLTIPPHRARDIAASGSEEREAWLADLQRTITALSDRWSLTVGEPYLPGGCCAWVAPVRVEPEDDPLGLVGSGGSAPVGGRGSPSHGPSESPRSSVDRIGDPGPQPHGPSDSRRSSADRVGDPGVEYQALAVARHQFPAGVSS